jgi:hypothetical protein
LLQPIFHVEAVQRLPNDRSLSQTFDVLRQVLRELIDCVTSGRTNTKTTPPATTVSVTTTTATASPRRHPRRTRNDTAGPMTAAKKMARKSQSSIRRISYRINKPVANATVTQSTVQTSLGWRRPDEGCASLTVSLLLPRGLRTPVAKPSRMSPGRLRLKRLRSSEKCAGSVPDLERGSDRRLEARHTRQDSRECTRGIHPTTGP